MATTLKPIKTQYKGYRFRSRLEARWAVFFDALGVRWEYEKEGFDLGEAGYYLPDFWLPELGVWIEIKGQKPTAEEEAKAHALAQGTGHHVILFPCGLPEVQSEYEVSCPSDDCDGAYLFDCGEGWDNYYRWCICPDCGKAGIEFDGRSDRLACKECFLCWHARTRPDFSPDGCETHGKDKITGCPRGASNGDKTYTPGHPRIAAALVAARRARFEFGERGGHR